VVEPDALAEGDKLADLGEAPISVADEDLGEERHDPGVGLADGRRLTVETTDTSMCGGVRAQRIGAEAPGRSMWCHGITLPARRTPTARERAKGPGPVRAEAEAAATRRQWRPIGDHPAAQGNAMESAIPARTVRVRNEEDRNDECWVLRPLSAARVWSIFGCGQTVHRPPRIAIARQSRPGDCGASTHLPMRRARRVTTVPRARSNHPAQPSHPARCHCR
jgi:hypothetical protein